MKKIMLFIGLLILLCSFGFVSGASTLLTGLESFYNLDNLSDAHSTYDLTKDGTPVVTTGKVGNAYNFTASGQHLKNSAGDKLTDDISIGGWFYRTGDGGASELMLGSTTWAQSYVFVGLDNSNVLIGNAYGLGGASGCQFNTGWAMNSGEWFHIVYTLDSGTNTATLYVNGAVNGSVTHADCSGVQWYISRFINTWGLRDNEWFNGIEDEVGYWNRTLSQAEVTEWYNSGNGNAYPFGAPAPAPNMTMTLNYPVNETTYTYGLYNDAINITVANANGSFSCDINDTHWVLNSSLPLTNGSVDFIGSGYNPGNQSIYINCTDSSGHTDSLTFWFTIESGFNTSFIYPTNETTYYGSYNGSIVINGSDNWGDVTCSINDTRWTLETATPLGSGFYVWQNNTEIRSSNNSIYVNCTDGSGKTQDIYFWFYTETILDIYVYDESTPTVLLNRTITLDLVSDFIVNNYTFMENYSVYSLTPGDYELTYTSDGYVTRQGYITVLEGAKQNISLFLVNSSLVTQIIAHVFDEYGNNLEDYTVMTMRRITGNYYNVETSRTNFEGQTDFYAVKNTPMYYWYVKYNDEILKQTTETEIYTDTIDLRVVLGTPIGHLYQKYGALSYTLSFDNNTNKFTYNFIDGSDSSTESRLSVYKLPNRDFIRDNYTTTTAGIITVNIADVYENGSTYIGVATMNYSPATYIDTLSHSYPEGIFDIGQIGLFVTLLLLLLFLFVGFWNPAIMFVLEGLIIILTRVVGLHYLDYITTTTIMVLCLVSAYLVSDRT